jgi:riboflavin transporter FmnP
MFALEFPLPGFPPYLKYDPSDVCGLLAAFSFGPAAGFLVELIKSILFFLSGKSADGIVGATAALVAGGTLVVAAGKTYALGKRPLVLSLLVGTVSMTVLMVTANYFIFLPLWGLPTHQITMPLVISMTGFNLVKGIITSILTMIIYQSLRTKIGLKGAETRA